MIALIGAIRRTLPSFPLHSLAFTHSLREKQLHSIAAPDYNYFEFALAGKLSSILLFMCFFLRFARTHTSQGREGVHLVVLKSCLDDTY